MIIVAGWLEVDQGQRDSFVAASAEAVRAARLTPGCLDFAVSADSVRADRVNVSERWTDDESLQAFRGSGPAGELGTAITAYHVEEYRLDG